MGGALLSGASHLHGFPPAIRLVFGAYLGVVTAHFVIDAGFWRMRDPFPRAFLACALARPAPRTAAASGRRWIVRRYRVTFMAKKTQRGDGEAPAQPLASFGRYAGPATLILSSLADGAKHGYALTKDIEAFADVRLAPGTLYEALAGSKDRA